MNKLIKRYPYTTIVLVVLAFTAAVILWGKPAHAAMMLATPAQYNTPQVGTATPKIEMANAQSITKSDAKPIKKTRAEIRKEKEIAKIMAEVMRLLVKLNALQTQ